MKTTRLLLILLLLSAAGCTTNVCIPGEARPIITGTDTQVVRVSVDASGRPAVDVEPVFVLPGETVVFAGPAEFTVRFAEDSPVVQRELDASAGAVSIHVPDRPYNRKKFFSAIENVELERLLHSDSDGIRVYKYDVVVNGHVLDLHLVLPE